MILLLILLLPAFVAAGMLYLFITLGEAVVTAAVDWLVDHV